MSFTTTATMNYWLLAVPATILLVLLALSQRRALALALTASAALHVAAGLYLWSAPAELEDTPPSAVSLEPFPMNLPPPEEPKSEREHPFKGRDAGPAWADALETKLPRLSESDLPLRSATTLPIGDLGPVPKLDVKVAALTMPQQREPDAKRLNQQAVDLEDEIAKRLRDAGGEEGIITFTLIWFNRNDLDLHVKDPTGNWIYFARPQGKLDVDRNASDSNLTDQPIENIRWPIDGPQPPAGKYTVLVDHYRVRGADATRFFVRIKIGNRTTHLLHGTVTRNPGTGPDNPEATVIEFDYPGK